MAMVVSILNVTDAPASKKPPTRVAIYTTYLDPGEELKLPAAMVDARLRKLETDGYVVIGQVPSWYEASKARKLGRLPITKEQIEANSAAAHKKAEDAKPAEVPPVEAPKKRVKLEDLAAEAKKSDKK